MSPNKSADKNTACGTFIILRIFPNTMPLKTSSSIIGGRIAEPIALAYPSESPISGDMVMILLSANEMKSVITITQSTFIKSALSIFGFLTNICCVGL